MYLTRTAVMCTSSDSTHFKKLQENLTEQPKANSVSITLYIYIYIYTMPGSILYMQLAAKTVTNVAKVIKVQKSSNAVLI
jgi:hypothetical protein